MPMSTQLVNCRAEFWTQTAWIQSPCLCLLDYVVKACSKPCCDLKTHTSHHWPLFLSPPIAGGQGKSSLSPVRSPCWARLPDAHETWTSGNGTPIRAPLASPTFLFTSWSVSHKTVNPLTAGYVSFTTALQGLAQGPVHSSCSTSISCLLLNHQVQPAQSTDKDRYTIKWIAWGPTTFIWSGLFPALFRSSKRLCIFI